MRITWQRVAPFVLAGLLVLNLVEAFLAGGQGRWLVVAILALALGLTLWHRPPAAP